MCALVLINRIKDVLNTIDVLKITFLLFLGVIM